MRVVRIIIGVIISLAALFSGGGTGMAMGGFGICAMDFGPGLLAGGIIEGDIFSGLLALLWPKVWWVGALVFSLPMLLGVPFAASNREWQRIVGICICIVCAFFVAFAGGHLDSLAKKSSAG